MLEIIKGDLLCADVDIIAHQVNCKKVMNAGVAKALRSKYPEVYAEYIKIPREEMKLGRVQIVETKGPKVANMFMQNRYGNDGQQYTSYRAMRKAIISLIEYMKQSNQKTVAMPYGIGCGYGGADWNEVYAILKEYFEKRKTLTLYLYKLEEIG